jgi:hypothetical protein
MLGMNYLFYVSLLKTEPKPKRKPKRNLKRTVRPIVGVVVVLCPHDIFGWNKTVAIDRIYHFAVPAAQGAENKSFWSLSY